ncbi:MAG: hypothetical protein F6K22_37820 [Okeania sp. SIO2F4]|uniref:hypothetical protein n=1 Tax=Okeania sp. SIO2F4 TaxID=2607790 RepID=UPI001429C3B6|nr:hypothetical protein [Okeania sp. SIO2F4]NES08038.1 hypothetical protein [Okeania sp. SIO2F4]
MNNSVSPEPLNASTLGRFEVTKIPGIKSTPSKLNSGENPSKSCVLVGTAPSR